jgi:hypothetical protein
MPSTYHVLAQANSGAGRSGNTVTNKALTSNVATLTTGSVHGYVAGDNIVVSIGDNVFDGGFVVASAPTTTTLTYARTAANVTSVAVTGGLITGGTPRSFAYVNNVVSTSNICTLTTAAAHGFVAGDIVLVSGVSSSVDGTVVVASAPTTTTFTFPITTATISTAAVSPTGVAQRLPAPGVSVSNRGSVNNTVQLTTSAAHGLAVDDYVQVQIGVANVDGNWRVTGVPSSTTLSYATTASGAITSGASFAGAIARRAWNGYLYTVPTGYSAVVSTMAIANRDTSTAFFRIAIVPAGETFNESDFIAYNTSVGANDTIHLTIGATLAARDQVYFWSSSPSLTFTLFGVENN